MKKTEKMKNFDSFLHSSKLVAGGFMGDDNRDINEIIDADAAIIEKLGHDMKDIAARMQQITDAAKNALGNHTDIDGRLTAWADEVKGMIVCPWPHPAAFDKRVTTVVDKNTNEKISWSDLNIHLISEHSFFEGKGSPMRIDPEILVKLIF